AKVNIFDMLRLAGIKTDIKIKNPSKTVRCELNFQGLKNDADIPERDRQRIKKVENLSSNGTKNVIIEIRKESLDNFKALPLPITFYKNYQKATQFIQSDSREIKNIAKEISKLSGNDSLLFVKETLKWFSKNIKESMVENFSALDTLKKGEGECQSHSYLFSAIMRAGNIPCRIVSGLVYPDGYNAFMYHSWCEVYLGKWVSVDPSLKQFPADSTHLVLAEGDIFSQAKIANFMRNSGIKVLKIQYD
ncbi:MAG: transglutaminase domain-containing protein, partial [Candidatus Schekmanbacteria bacterium]